jgi:hypothetical protein
MTASQESENEANGLWEMLLRARCHHQVIACNGPGGRGVVPQEPIDGSWITHLGSGRGQKEVKLLLMKRVRRCRRDARATPRRHRLGWTHHIFEQDQRQAALIAHDAQIEIQAEDDA